MLWFLDVGITKAAEFLPFLIFIAVSIFLLWLLCSGLKIIIYKLEQINHLWLVNEKKDDGFAPIHLACLNNNYETTKLLIENGSALIDSRNLNHQSPLHLAVERLNAQIVKLLVQKKANVNLEDSDGDTPLHCAIRHYTLARVNNWIPLRDQPKVIKLSQSKPSLLTIL